MIARRTPLPRPTKPIARKAAKPKRRLAVCPVARCKRYPYRRDRCDNLCVVHLRKRLDDAARRRCLADWGWFCVAEGYARKSCSPDSGTPSIQWAHIVRRGRGLTRRLTENARPLCAVHHSLFTHAPEAWTLFVDDLIGVEAHRELMRRSLADGQIDMEDEWNLMQVVTSK